MQDVPEKVRMSFKDANKNVDMILKKITSDMLLSFHQPSDSKI